MSMEYARSGLDDIWNYRHEGSTYLYAQAKKGATFMLRTWRLGLIFLLVLVSLPFLAPVILASLLVGCVFLVPLLCGATVYYVVFHPISLSTSIIKWCRSPKSVLGLGAHSTTSPENGESSTFIQSPEELVPSEESNQEKTVHSSSAPDEIEQEMVEESKAFEILPKEEDDDEVIALGASENRLDEEVATSGRFVSKECTKDPEEESPHEESVIGFPCEAPLAAEGHQELGGHEGVQGEEMDKALDLSENGRGHEKEDPTSAAPSYEEPAEDGTQQILEEVNKDVVDPSDVGRSHALEGPTASEEPEYFVESKAVEQEQGEGHPVAHLTVPDTEDQYLEESEAVKEVKEEPGDVQFDPAQQDLQLEEPKRLDEGTAAAQPASEDWTASGEPEFLVESDAVEEEQGEGHPNDHLNASGVGHEYLKEIQAVTEPGKVLEHPLLSDGQQELLETPERQEEWLAESLSVSKDSAAFGEPQNDFVGETEEPGQAPSAFTQPLLFKGKHEHSEPGLPLKHVVQQVDGTAPIEGESDIYESASDSFSPSENEQEPVAMKELNGREDAVHGLDSVDFGLVGGNTESSLEEVVAEEAPVVREEEVELLKEKEAPGVEEEAPATPALEPEGTVVAETEKTVGDVEEEVACMEEAPEEAERVKEVPAIKEAAEDAVPVEDVPAMKEVQEDAAPVEEVPAVKEVQEDCAPVEEKAAPVEEEAAPVEEEAAPVEDEAAPIEEAASVEVAVEEPIVEKVEEPGALMVEEDEVKAPVPLPEGVEEQGTNEEVSEENLEVVAHNESIDDCGKFPSASISSEHFTTQQALKPVSFREDTQEEGTREEQAGEASTETSAQETTLHISSQADSGASSKAIVETLLSPDDGFETQKHGTEEFTRLEANMESGSGGKLDIPSNIEESTVVDGNLNQAFEDDPAKIPTMKLEDASFTSASAIIAQLGDEGKEAKVDATMKADNRDLHNLQDGSNRDEAAEGHVLEPVEEEDALPTSRALNVAHDKESPSDAKKDENDSFFSCASAQRRLSFSEAGEDKEVKLGAPSPLNQNTGGGGTGFIFKSRPGRTLLPSHRHSAPDILAMHTWVADSALSAPQEKSPLHKKAKYKGWPEVEGVGRTYSASVTDSPLPHMAEFEGLLRLWHARDKAAHSPPISSPSHFLSLTEVEHQIREEISTIKTIIGQETPSQNSLWKEVQTLCQIVGMELPHMGDVSDLTKARHGLDLLKVVVGVK